MSTEPESKLPNVLTRTGNTTRRESAAHVITKMAGHREWRLVAGTQTGLSIVDTSVNHAMSMSSLREKEWLLKPNVD